MHPGLGKKPISYYRNLSRRYALGEMVGDSKVKYRSMLPQQPKSNQQYYSAPESFGGNMPATDRMSKSRRLNYGLRQCTDVEDWR